MSDKSLHDNMLKLVRYKILFLKRDYEHAFPDQEELIADNLDATSYTAWKIAAFIQHLGQRTTPVPAHWRQYPPNEPQYQMDGKLVGLPDEDKQYLRVQYNVLERRPRQPFRFAEEQVKVLAQIRNNLQWTRSSQDQAERDRLQQELTQAQTALATSQAESARLQQQLTQAQAALVTAQAERDHAQQELTQTQATLATTQAERDRLQQALTTAQAEIVRLQQQLASAQSEHVQTQTALEQARAELSSLRQEGASKDARVQQLEQEIQLLRQGGSGAPDAIYHLGASGGPGGAAFEDYIVPEYARLHAIRLRVTGQAIQAIQAIYVDAQGQTFFYME